MLLASAMIYAVAFKMLRMLTLSAKWKGRIAQKQLATRAGAGDFADRYSFFLMCFAATFREGVEAIVFITGVSAGSPMGMCVPAACASFSHSECAVRAAPPFAH